FCRCSIPDSTTQLWVMILPAMTTSWPRLIRATWMGRFRIASACWGCSRPMAASLAIRTSISLVMIVLAVCRGGVSRRGAGGAEIDADFRDYGSGFIENDDAEQPAGAVAWNFLGRDFGEGAGGLVLGGFDIGQVHTLRVGREIGAIVKVEIE